MNPDLDLDEAPAADSIQVSAEGVNIRKRASTRGEDAVVVDFTLRSGRDDQCRIRIEDEIPAQLRGNPIEFHPRFDPGNWTRESARVVYEAPIGPGVVRRSAYGIIVDDLGQVDLFRTQPTVETSEVEDPALIEPDDADSFEFVGTDQSDPSTDDPVAPLGRQHKRSINARPGQDSVVGSFISELQQRELTPAERRALREALGLEASPPVVDELREAVGELEDRTDDLETTVDREVRWRSELQEHFANDPDDS